MAHDHMDYGENSASTARRPGEIGKVFLVGAGPGDPDLLTLKGKRCLETADVVVYDALVGAALLEHCPKHTRRLYVGKRDGRHSLLQKDINALLVKEASAGNVVVRLKGGDPFVFGRGGEEALDLRAAGVPFEMVPGVSAGVAVPSYAGIPVTHREVSGAVTFFTAHECPKTGGPSVPWDALARAPGTLVGFMGVRRLNDVAAGLVAGGRSVTTPAAVISQGTTSKQRTVVGTLGTIAELVAQANLEPPGLLVVGEVVRLREALEWVSEGEACALMSSGFAP